MKENIVELEHSMLESFRETKPIDYEDKIDKLNNTIDNLQSSINALSFNQLPAIHSKEYRREASFDFPNRIRKGITKTISYSAITSQIEVAESQQEVFSTPTLTLKKKSPILYYYDSDSELETY